MKTSDLILRLTEAMSKYGDKEIAGEVQMVNDQNEVVVGVRVPCLVIAEPDKTKIILQLKTQINQVNVKTTD